MQSAHQSRQVRMNGPTAGGQLRSKTPAHRLRAIARVDANRPEAGKVVGREKVLRFIDGISRKGAGLATIEGRAATINGLPGFMLRDQDGAIDTIALEARDDRITAIYVTHNPDNPLTKSQAISMPAPLPNTNASRSRRA